ncbi:MAG TPA: hypothetical protein DCE56_42385, partial [Cyanobacteria bacterium UBA8553]|nr:hypothetical protein [Cyanobacteria bacterium UBA8553]
MSAVAGFSIFVPWLVIFIANERHASKKWAWVVQNLPTGQFYQRWVTNLVRGFFDVQIGTDDPFNVPLDFTHPKTYLMVPILLLVGYSMYFLWRNTPARIWLFVLMIVAFSTLPMALPDLISGGMRSTIPRYQLPSYLGIQLAVSYLLAAKLSDVTSGIWQQKLWRGITVSLISCGVI